MQLHEWKSPALARKRTSCSCRQATHIIISRGGSRQVQPAQEGVGAGAEEFVLLPPFAIPLVGTFKEQVK